MSRFDGIRHYVELKLNIILIQHNVYYVEFRQQKRYY